MHPRERTGHDFPVLSWLRHGRAIRSIASTLRESPNPETTVTGLGVKVLAGAIFAELVADVALAANVRALAPRNGVTEAQLDAARRFATDPNAEPPGGDATTRAALLLARAASPSPAETDAGIVAACRDAKLSAQAIVELVSWPSVLQVLHRLTSFYPPGTVTLGQGRGAVSNPSGDSHPERWPRARRRSTRRGLTRIELPQPWLAVPVIGRYAGSSGIPHLNTWRLPATQLEPIEERRRWSGSEPRSSPCCLRRCCSRPPEMPASPAGMPTTPRHAREPVTSP